VRRKNAAVITAAFPNPASDMLHVQTNKGSGQSTDAMLELFDSQGQAIRSVHMSADSEDELITFDVRELPAGRYTVRLRSGESISVRTIVVVR
jgi:hypothetical protein